MDDNILSALGALQVADLTHQEWITVGMALKEEGYPCSIWDDWSRNDTRYHPGECVKKWQTFRGSGKPVKGGTICQMAKERGWLPYADRNEGMGWNDVIEYDGDGFTGFTQETLKPTEELITYIETLFNSNDYVAYVTNDVWQNTEGKWLPSKGVYTRTAGELIESLKKHPDDLGATVGDWKPDAGAWVRFNPVDGEGVKNENVTSFKYALVESDDIPVTDQEMLYRKLELPIAALVSSGGKSLHAIVHVDATNYEEYRKRVEFLYDFLDQNGVCVDRQNRNPSRLSRMPGVTRNGNRQHLVATNIGRKSWVEWLDFAEGVTDELPGMVSLIEYKDAPPALPEELICGILRRGHKMLISGSSKAGKSFLLMELCIAIAEGIPWLGFECKKGRVLYVNLEIDPASSINRFMKIYDALGIPMTNAQDIVIWNLRGHAVPLDKLVPKLIRRVRDMHLDAIVLDPIYKVITGDENNASEMGAFCNQFDKICTETGCSTIYCHHHSKGAQGGKKAMDRASGSGVFARDPDAQLDMIQLELSDDIKNNVVDGYATAWRLESSLREFPNIKPLDFWFEYPIHRVDTSGELSNAPCEGDGSMRAARAKNKKATTKEERRESIYTAYQNANPGGIITVRDIAEYLNITERCARDRIKELADEFNNKRGVITRKS